jgi:hypothetical protein
MSEPTWVWDRPAGPRKNRFMKGMSMAWAEYVHRYQALAASRPRAVARASAAAAASSALLCAAAAADRVGVAGGGGGVDAPATPLARPLVWALGGGGAMCVCA